MTEEEWLTCSDPIAMVEYLHGSRVMGAVPPPVRFEGANKGKDRKFRLLACLSCRRIWDYIPEACNKDAVVAVEGFLEGEVTGSVVQEALGASSRVEYTDEGQKRDEPGYWAVKTLGRGFYKMTAAASAILVFARAVCRADKNYGLEVFLHCSFHSLTLADAGPARAFQWPVPIPPDVEAEREIHARFLRCIFGNPFRPTTIDPAWLSWHGRTVPSLAQAAYDERELPSGHLECARLAILADALEEAGCTSADILGHLRGSGPHVRGCWVIDLLLGKQ